MNVCVAPFQGIYVLLCLDRYNVCIYQTLHKRLT